MGILDEAIREHLELKRQHGADDSELKVLEDDAFGPPQRPGAEPAAGDGPAEAATEFMDQPDLGNNDEAAPEADGEAPAATQTSARREPIAEVQEAPEGDDDLAAEEKPAEDDEPAEEEQPAGEHEAVPAPPPASHTTAERHAIADQPTEMFDVEGEIAASEAAPSDEELVAEEITEPRLAPAPADPVEDDDEDDFFDEQRLSDELDQALEAPVEPDSEEMEPISEETPRPVPKVVDPDPDSEEIARPAAAPRNDDEDVLEDTPDFLEEAPEDDQLWFEQKPPKDFDFDD